MSGEGGPLPCHAGDYDEVESYVTRAPQRPLEHLGGSPDAETKTAEERVLALLAADPVCLGRVARVTVRSLAFLIVTPPAPLAIDGAAERADVLAYLGRRRDNAAAMARTDLGGAEFARDRERQIEVEISDIEQGLHAGAAEVARDLAGQGV